MDNVPSTNNWILQRLPEDTKRAFFSVAEFMHLDVHEDLIKPNEKIKFVDFPESGVISVVNEGDNGAVVEIATVGREGFVGTSLLLSIDSITERAFCQIEATSWRIPSKQFARMIEKYPEFLKLCQLYDAALYHQVVNNMSCNALHSVEQRCARWLLTSQDRSAQDSFFLTQEFLGQMLNIGRGRVNLVAGVFQNAGMIKYVRGKLTIVDRTALEGVACSCYKKIHLYTEKLVKETKLSASV